MKRFLTAAGAAALLILSANTAWAAQIDNGLPGPQPIDMAGIMLNAQMFKVRQDAINGTTPTRKAKISQGTINFLRRYHPDSPDLPENAAKNKVRARGKSTKINLAATKYHSVPQVSAKTRETFLRWTATQSPPDAEKLRQVFAQHDPVQIWAGLTHSYGLQSGDLADAFAAYWALNYGIANRLPDVGRPQVVGLRDQMRLLFARTPAITEATSAQKQQMAETWMLNFLVQQGAYDAATKKGDKAALQKLSEAALLRFQNELHLDPAKIALTGKGFGPRAS